MNHLSEAQQSNHPLGLRSRPEFCTVWARGHAPAVLGSGALEYPRFHATWAEAAQCLAKQAQSIESELLRLGAQPEEAAKARGEACMLLDAELRSAAPSGQGVSAAGPREAAFCYEYGQWSWHACLVAIPTEVESGSPVGSPEGSDNLACAPQATR